MQVSSSVSHADARKKVCYGNSRRRRGWGCGFQISRRYIGILARMQTHTTAPSQECFRGVATNHKKLCPVAEVNPQGWRAKLDTFCGWLKVGALIHFLALGVGPCFGMTIICSSLPKCHCVRKERSRHCNSQASIPRLCQKIPRLEPA